MEEIAIRFIDGPLKDETGIIKHDWPPPKELKLDDGIVYHKVSQSQMPYVESKYVMRGARYSVRNQL